MAVFCLLFLVEKSEGAESLIQVKQGDVVRLAVEPGVSATTVRGKFGQKSIPFFETGKGIYATIIGIDMDHSTGLHPFAATWDINGQTIRQEYQIEIVPASFAIQKLTLPKGMVDLDSKTLARVKREKGLMKAAFRESINKRLWRGNFIAPVKGKRQSTFGRRRILNGQPRRPHTGEDITAPTGAPISAANGGKVVLVGDFFFNGRSIVIDHGLGLFSMYFHLSEISVVEGERVKKGGLIGRVGQSGRVTGAHLHWGMRLNDARVDPFSLVNKELD